MDTVRDPLYARILVLEQNGCRYVHAALDSLQAPIALVNEVRKRLEQAWGLPTRVIISGTHTHFAPDMRVESYRNQVRDQLCEALIPLTLREAELTCSYVREPFTEVGQSRISHWTTDQIFAHALCFYAVSYTHLFVRLLPDAKRGVSGQARTVQLRRDDFRQPQSVL